MNLFCQCTNAVHCAIFSGVNGTSTGESLQPECRDQALRMSGFATRFSSVVCLLVIITGSSSALFWRPTVPSYPTNPNDPYYKAFEKVPSPNVTAKKLMTNFLGYGQTKVVKRQTIIEDIVIVMDGSGSVGYCEFKKGKEALKHMMATLHNPRIAVSKFAAVTFASTVTVNFKFLPYLRAASKITNIPYPSGMTNTQAGLAEAKRLFDDPGSGRSRYPTKRMVLLVTDGQSNIQTRMTIPNANALKNSGVQVFVVGVGSYIHGIDEMVKVASYPPDQFLFRVKNLAGFWKVIQLIVRQVAPHNWAAVNYDPPCY